MLVVTVLAKVLHKDIFVTLSVLTRIVLIKESLVEIPVEILSGTIYLYAKRVLNVQMRGRVRASVDKPVEMAFTVFTKVLIELN